MCMGEKPRVLDLQLSHNYKQDTHTSNEEHYYLVIYRVQSRSGRLHIKSR